MKKRILIIACAVIGALLIAFIVLELCGFRFAVENTLSTDERKVVSDAIYEKDWVFLCTSRELVNAETGKTTEADQFFCAVKRYGPLYRRQTEDALPLFEVYEKATGEQFGWVFGFEDAERQSWFLLLKDYEQPTAIAGAWFERLTVTANGTLTGLYKGAYFITPTGLSSLIVNGHEMELVEVKTIVD